MTDPLTSLAAEIRARRLDDAASAIPSYTRQLLAAGPDRCARKFGEEAVELVVASLAAGTSTSPDGRAQRLPLSKVEKDAVASEAADVIYHLLVLLESRDVPWQDVTAMLVSRMGTSGIAEKASRRAAAD